MATPETQLTGNEFVGFQNVELSQKLEGPSLPEPAIHGLVVKSSDIGKIFESLNAGEKVIADVNAALTDRPAAFLVLSVFPVPRGNEVDARKARKVYGVARGVDLPFADGDNNRLRISSTVFAQSKKEEDTDAGDGEDTEK